jgi:hypothetical protein
MCNIWVIVRSALMGPPNSASHPAVIGPAINRSGHSVGGRARANGASRHAVPHEFVPGESGCLPWCRAPCCSHYQMAR